MHCISARKESLGRIMQLFFTVPHCACVQSFIHLVFFFILENIGAIGFCKWIKFPILDLKQTHLTMCLQPAAKTVALLNLLRCWKEAKEKQPRRQPSGLEGGKEKNKHLAQEVPSVTSQKAAQGKKERQLS